MSKHTPGPWELVRYTGHDPERDYPGRIDSAAGVVVFAGPFSFRALRGRTAAEAEANACLMAAAPELLAACKAIRNEVDDMTKGFESGDAADRILAAAWKRLVAKCDAAIAKAEPSP
jgi:hypothetical protein